MPSTRLAAVASLIVLALALSACGRKGDVEVPLPQDYRPNGKLKPDAPMRAPGSKPIFKEGFLLDPLL